MERFCTACGKALAKGTSFCGACGKSTQAGQSTPADAATQSPSTSNPSASGNQDATGGTSAQTSHPSRPAAALPPESIFAATGDRETTSSSAGISAEADAAYFEEQSEGNNTSAKYWIGGAVIFLLLLSGVYYALFLADDMAEDEGGRPTAAADVADEAPPEPKLFYASAGANIRDKADAENGEILGKLTRGDEARGIVIQAEDDKGDWLELEDDAGFVFMANLAESERPELAKNLGRKRISLAGPVNLLSAPSEDAETLDSLSKGLGLTISGITANDYAEVLLRKGGVGYIANGAKVVKDGDGPKGEPLAIKLDVQGCASGSKVDAMFKQLMDESSAELQKIEGADYPDDAARQAALDAYYGNLEGKSRYRKLTRSFEGLQVTAIASHYEARALYFAESPDKVIAVFKKLGHKVGSDGALPSRDISAGIYPTRGDGKKYGKSSLECGV